MRKGTDILIMKQVKLDNTRIPLHYQIADYLIERLSSCDMDYETQLMPEEELRAIFGVSRTTIRRALLHLIHKGLLDRKQGKGTFWTPAARNLRHRKLSGINRQIFNIKEETRVRVLSKKNENAPLIVASFLGLPEGSEIVVFQRQRFENNQTISYTINYLPHHIGDKIGKEHLKEMTMLETLEKVASVNLGTIEHNVEITRADVLVALHLGISVLDPVLTVNTLVYDTDKNPVEIVWTHFVESKYKFRVVLDK